MLKKIFFPQKLVPIYWKRVVKCEIHVSMYLLRGGYPTALQIDSSHVQR